VFVNTATIKTERRRVETLAKRKKMMSDVQNDVLTVEET